MRQRRRSADGVSHQPCTADEKKDDVVRGLLVSANVDDSRRRKRGSLFEVEVEVVECDTNDNTRQQNVAEATGNEDDDPSYLEFLLFLRNPPALEEKEGGIIGGGSDLSVVNMTSQESIVGGESFEETKKTKTMPDESYSQLGAVGANDRSVEKRDAPPEKFADTNAAVTERTPVSDNTTSASQTSSIASTDGAEFIERSVDTAVTSAAGADSTSKTSCHAVKKVDNCLAAESPPEQDKENVPTNSNSPGYFPVTSLVRILSTHRRHGGKCCQVVRHTPMFVVVRARDSKEEFRIMPKFLARVEGENRAVDDVGAKLANLLASPPHFPVGSGIAVDRTHARHGGKRGVVMRHTREFVAVRFSNENGNETRIKPKFLTIIDNC